jgi:hypothetical protein
VSHAVLEASNALEQIAFHHFARRDGAPAAIAAADLGKFAATR